ncbi:hypothetical protein evm_002929 [Chilo suppressalis]|nr:hypothetical protein evm_002929 [Chilo suppressalis]
MENVKFSPIATPTHRNSLKGSQQQYFCKKSPGGMSLSNFSELSGNVSLNDISKENLMQVSLPLDEQNIHKYIRTPTRNSNQVTESGSQSDCEIYSHLIKTKAEVYEQPKETLKMTKSAMKAANLIISSTNECDREFQYSLDVIHDSSNPDNDIKDYNDSQNDILGFSGSSRYKKQTESKLHSEKQTCNEDVIEETQSDNETLLHFMNDEQDTNSDKDYCVSNDEDSDTFIPSSMLSCDRSSVDEDEFNNVIENDDEIDKDDDDDDWDDISEELSNIDEFVGTSVINVPIDDKTPSEIYKLFLTEDIIKKMVIETNNYAAQFIENNNLKSKSRSNQWNSTNYDEMLRFLGVIMVMGLNKVPHINDYWSKKSLYRNEYICSVMKRDRFLLLLKFWHFSEDHIGSKTDKLHKIRDIFNMLLERFNNILTPGKHVVIDETMIPWPGRLKFRQYIKNKTHKYGVKLYKICTPEGYTYDILIYTGKGENGREIIHGQNTVLKLVNKLKGHGRIVIAVNFYTSINLAEELLLNKTFLCGTIKPNRKGLPKTVTATKLKRGEICGKMNKKGVRVIKWVDKRPVSMISTCKNHDIRIKDTGQARRGTNENIKKPECILTYNDTKKGIDYSDQMSSYYTTLKRGLKWYRKVVMELIFGTAMVNAWIIFNMGKEKGMPKKEFTEAIIESFTGKPISAVINDKSRTNHTLEKDTKRRRCTGCYNKLRLRLSSIEAGKKVKKVPTLCRQCQKYLCLPCFNEEHKY